MTKSVSYTHLDVYKRQDVDGEEDVPLIGVVSEYRRDKGPVSAPDRADGDDGEHHKRYKLKVHVETIDEEP